MATQLQYSCLEHPMDAGALQATSHGVAKGGMLCPLSESPSRKREDLHDNATRKGREIYCLLEPGPLLQPTQWCKGREPRAPVSTHIYRVLDFKHKQWVVGASGLVTCLQSTFIGTNFRVCGAFQGTFPEVYRAHTDQLVAGGLLREIITPPSGETETQAYSQFRAPVTVLVVTVSQGHD